jgi:predicted SAM-dependent methyltransferase
MLAGNGILPVNTGAYATTDTMSAAKRLTNQKVRSLLFIDYNRVAVLRDHTVLSRFPKQRPPLPEAYQKIYVEHYRRNREGASAASSLSQKMESWMHRKVAEDVAGIVRLPRTLEIGAGGLNHLQYEPPSGDYDVVEPIINLVTNSPRRSRVTNAYSDVRDASGKYERIISIAAFEHYCNLPEVISRCKELLAPGGSLRIAVPSEGTILWTLGWKLTTGLEFRLKYGLDYGVLMKYEHVNTAAEIESVLQAFFSVKKSVLGLSGSFSFYQFFHCS